MKACIATAIFVLITQFCFAHGNMIKGKVTDSLTHEMLPGATITLNQRDEIAIADHLGNFRFDNLQDGTYTIRVTFIGYQPYELTVVLANDETQIVSIALLATSIRLDQITITSDFSTEQALTTLSRVDEDLRPVKSSQEILRMIPGVVTSQHAGGGKAEQIFIRGFDADHGTDISLTVDGMPVNMVSHAHGQGYADLHFVTPEIIDFVDFNKGPYYSRIGDFGTAGYASFHTKNSLDQSSIKLEAGTFDTYRAVALLDLLGKAKKNQDAYVAAEYQYTNGPFISPQNFNRINLFGKYHGVIGEDRLLSISLSTFSSEWDASGQLPRRAIEQGLTSRFGAIDDTEGGFTGRSNINIALTKVFDDASAFKNQVYVSLYDFELYSNFTYFLHDPVNGDQIRQKEKRKIYGYNGTYQKDFHIGTRNVKSETGLSLRYDDVSGSELSRVKARNTFISPVSNGDINQVNGSVYTDFTVALAPNLSLNTGLRFDVFMFRYSNALATLYTRSSKSKNLVSPKLNLYYSIHKDIQLYLKNGFGFHSNDTRVVIAQDRDILPRAFGTDLGVFAKLFPNMLVNAALWQMRLEQEFVYVGDEAVVEPSGRTQRLGVDLSVRYQALSWLSIDFDGNYAHGRSLDSPEDENFIPLAPTLTSIGGLTSSFGKGWKASLRYRYVGDRPANEDNSVTAYGYFLLDGAITYTNKVFQVSLTASNILDRDWNEAQFDTETRLPGELTSISELCFTPGDPRFIKAGLTFFF